MRDPSRRLRKLRRRVYRDFPAAPASRIAEIDPALSYTALKETFAHGDLGVGPAGAAMALWRACSERGFRAWCYEFGFRGSLSLAVTVVETADGLQVHDPFLNRAYPAGFPQLIDRTRYGWTVTAEAEPRDRKLYLADPEVTPAAVFGWLAVHAGRELAPLAGLRRFELRWDMEALAATSPKAAGAARRELEARGHTADLDALLLFPLGVFDGERWHRDPATMPLIAGRDMRSPIADLRVAAARTANELAAARDEVATLSGSAQESRRDAARMRAAYDEALRQAAAERNLHLRERAALVAENAQFAAQLTAAHDEVAARDSRVAQQQAALDDLERAFVAERQGLLSETGRLAAALAAADARAARLRERVAAREAQAARQLARLLEGPAVATSGRRDQIFEEFAALADEESGIEPLLMMVAADLAEAARCSPPSPEPQAEPKADSAEAAPPPIAAAPGEGPVVSPPVARAGRLRRLFRGLLGRSVAARRLRR